MRILIAEDDPVSRRLLESTLVRWGHEVVVTTDGEEAWAALAAPGAPPLAILDWMMPGIDGVELSRRLHERGGLVGTYVLILTARGRTDDLVTALEAGADDFVTKPFQKEELRARIRAGERILALRESLGARVAELEHALAEVRSLQGILPICAFCKNIRNDSNYWLKVETYLSEHAGASFTHSVCPQCYADKLQPELDQARTSA